MDSQEALKTVLSHPKLSGDSPLREYLLPFLNFEEEFLKFYDFLPNKTITTTSYTRGSFWVLVKKALWCLIKSGLVKGDHHVHYFSGNSVIDLAIRTASVLIGTVPVTVNWQADNIDQVKYKITATTSKLIFVDDKTPHMTEMQLSFPSATFVLSTSILSLEEFDDILSLIESSQLISHSDVRCIIFTSGTTGNPKGVELSYGNYTTNRQTFENFLGFTDERTTFVPIVVNPMHHTNSTSITDWAVRRPGTKLHLLERYSTQYWNILVDIHAEIFNSQVDQAEVAAKRVIAPLVSRHIDFLESYMESDSVSQAIKDTLSDCLKETVLLLGSAPVGPSTCARLLKYAKHLPLVRFGSTETTLQVCGIPMHLSSVAVMTAFQRGWEHRYHEEACEGFYIGRDHFPWTEVDIVRSVTPGDEGFLKTCDSGVPGYIVTRGGHIFRSYAGLAMDITAKVKSADGWYLNLGDIGFWLEPTPDSKEHTSALDEGCHQGTLRITKDFYWQTRDSQMLIRGGSNYAYEQVNADLSSFVTRFYGLPPSCFSIAVCGSRVVSEHEDECCVMMQLNTPLPVIEIPGVQSFNEAALVSFIEFTFLKAANKADAGISKGSKPSRFCVGTIPIVVSKGVVSVPELSKFWKNKILQEAEH